MPSKKNQDARDNFKLKRKNAGGPPTRTGYHVSEDAQVQQNHRSEIKPVAKKESAVLCAAQFNDYQLQAVCMDNERDSFEKMQNDFGLPGKVAIDAKARCERLFPMSQLQAVCMQNEKDGYDKMQQYR